MQKNIIIIDSGIDLNNTNFNNDELIFKSLISDSIQDSLGHGTAIYSILRRQLTNYHISIIKIFNSYNVDVNLLVEALEYIYKNYTDGIINMSLGIFKIRNITKLTKICRKLFNKGFVLISALSNDGGMSYPASLPMVIGVDNYVNCKTINEYAVTNNKNINFCAYGQIQRVKGLNNKSLFMSGTSLACANFTNIFCDMYVKCNYNRNVTLSKLTEEATYKIFISEFELYNLKRLKSIQNIAVFPFTKEIISLIHFETLLPFKIKRVFDYSSSFRIGANVSQIFPYINSNLKIENILDFQKSNDFDTIVIGCMDFETNVYNFSELKKIFYKMTTFNKQIIFLDDKFENLLSYHKNIHTIKLTEKYKVKNFCGKLWNINVPVLGIFGTSSKQGKMTLQLNLRKEFLKNYYKLGQIGSEPQSLLFDFDTCVPYGFNCTNTLNGEDLILYLNHSQHYLESKKKVDIIIVGGQSNVINHQFKNAYEFNLTSEAFIVGCNPDIIILCINVFDSIKYIEKSVKYMETITNSKVICFVLNRFNKNILGFVQYDDKHFEQQKANLEVYFNIPVFFDNEYKNVYNFIIGELTK